MVVDQYGAMYYKNDSRGFWALGSSFNVEGITLDKSEMTIEIGSGMHAIIATVMPAFADNKNVIWTSSKPEVATVDVNSRIMPVAVGTTTITATTEDGGFAAICEVTVVKPVTGVTLNEIEATLEVGETIFLAATVDPDDATDKTVTWSTANENIATVADNGVVTAVSPGETTITVTTINGNKTAICTIIVEPVAVASVTLDRSEISLKEDSVYKLTANIMPENATDKNITWTSSDENVVTVDVTGNIKAVTEGTAIITVTTVDGGFTATCTVKVEKNVTEVTGVSIDKTEFTLKVGEQFAITATVTPDNATNKNVTWTSSDETIATINENGVVAAVAEGETVVTVTTEDGEFTAECKVTVTGDETGFDEVMTIESVYPNPFDNELHIVVTEDITMYMYDNNGHLIKTAKLVNGDNIIYAGDLPAGIYMIRCGKNIYKVIKK
jgi:uncharacterized protein YjdB